MPRYYLEIWEWDVDRQEYLPQHPHECDDYESIKMVFDAITVNTDRPQVELYEVREDRDELIEYKNHWIGETE